MVRVAFLLLLYLVCAAVSWCMRAHPRGERRVLNRASVLIALASVVLARLLRGVMGYIITPQPLPSAFRCVRLSRDDSGAVRRIQSVVEILCAVLDAVVIARRTAFTFATLG